MHHRSECALCFGAASRQRLRQYARGDLPGGAPFVFAPAACALLPAIADDGVPIAIGLFLIVGGDLEREGFVMLEHRTWRFPYRHDVPAVPARTEGASGAPIARCDTASKEQLIDTHALSGLRAAIRT